MKHWFHKRDLLWIFAYPLYQLVGTLRHEVSHALAALLQGARIHHFVFWPTWTGSGVRWGYVSWSGPTTWVALAAPYLCDLATFVLVYLICTRLSFRHHSVWVNLVAMGLISPLVDSGYNYLNGLRGGGDVAQLLRLLPALAVHGYFTATLAAYALGLFLTVRPMPWQTAARESEEGSA
jgi:hypothetical protein